MADQESPVLDAVLRLTERVGEMSAEIRGIHQTQKEINQAIRQSEESASKSRAAMRDDIHALGDRVGKIEGRFDGVDRRLVALEETDRKTAEFIANQKHIKARNEGAVMVASWVGERAWWVIRWSAVTAGTGIVMFWREIIDFIRGG